MVRASMCVLVYISRETVWRVLPTISKVYLQRENSSSSFLKLIRWISMTTAVHPSGGREAKRESCTSTTAPPVQPRPQTPSPDLLHLNLRAEGDCPARVLKSLGTLRGLRISQEDWVSWRRDRKTKIIHNSSNCHR